MVKNRVLVRREAVSSDLNYANQESVCEFMDGWLLCMLRENERRNNNTGKKHVILQMALTMLMRVMNVVVGAAATLTTMR